MAKFNYAPGQPGYGTKGIDGSTGLLGLSIWGTDYNAVSNSVILNSRISSNLDLYSGSGIAIPGYPTRIYQTGDLFIGEMGSGNTYSFMIQDSVGCIATLDAIVNDINIPAITAVNANDASCYTLADGSIEINGDNLASFSIDNSSFSFVIFPPTF